MQLQGTACAICCPPINHGSSMLPGMMCPNPLEGELHPASGEVCSRALSLVWALGIRGLGLNAFAEALAQEQ